MGSLGIWTLVAIFVVAAGVVWVAGIRVSETTDVLSSRLGWGNAIGGLVALAFVTNLPEMAIVASGAYRGDLSLALGNILGGIAAQTVVLALLDWWGPKSRGTLTYRGAKPSLILEGLLVLAVLGLVFMGTQLPANAIAFRLTPIPPLIVLTWFFGIRLISKHGNQLPWQPTGEEVKKPKQNPRSAMSTKRAGWIFGLGALATLVAGVALEQSSDAIANHLGMSGAVFGATVLAAATSLPEVSTGLGSVRLGNDSLAISDVLGGNAFLPTLFFPAVLLSGKPVLAHAQPSDIYLTAVGVVLTVIFLCGLVIRPQKRVVGMGIDSLLIIVIYLGSMVGLAFIGNS